MKMDPSDLEIEVLVRRIQANELDLQPDFQRGEVWSEKKRQRLIDSILRAWHIPPIHVIEIVDTGREEVLDGQQRLATIRDFVAGRFRVDGSLPPYDDSIKALDGLRFAELPAEVQRRFNRFTIRQFRLTKYEPDEPAEIFFRLNQPTSLTTAEQRNAFIGRARSQVKSLVDFSVDAGLGHETIGFSNARMAYDDVFARVCLALERRTIRRKLVASDLTAAYRSSQGFNHASVSRVKDAIRAVAEGASSRSLPFRLNKATLFSWLWFVLAAKEWRIELGSPSQLGVLLQLVESLKGYARDGIGDEELRAASAMLGLLSVYDDRSTSRVSDVSSVLARDIVLWTIAVNRSLVSYTGESSRLESLVRLGQEVGETPVGAGELIDRFIQTSGWGDL